MLPSWFRFFKKIVSSIWSSKWELFKEMMLCMMLFDFRRVTQIHVRNMHKIFSSGLVFLQLKFRWAFNSPVEWNENWMNGYILIRQHMNKMY